MPEDFEVFAELSAAAAAELAASALASRGKRGEECANCGTPLIGPFCAACGQPHATYRKSLWRLLWQAVEHIVNFDSRLMRTSRALLLEPGELPRAFKFGQTQRYVPAPRLYLFTSLLFFLILSLSGIAILQFEINIGEDAAVTTAENGLGIEIGPVKKSPEFLELRRKIETGQFTGEDLEKYKAQSPSVSTRARFFSRIGKVQSKVPDAVRKQLAQLEADAEAKPPGTEHWFGTHLLRGLSDIAKDPASMNGPLTAWIPRVLFLLLPLFALILWLFYWRHRKKFLMVDHLVFSLTLHTFAFVVLILAAFAVQVAPADAVGWTVLIVILVYFFLSMKWFYDQTWFWTALKFATLGFIYTFFFLIPALVVVLFLSMVQA